MSTGEEARSDFCGADQRGRCRQLCQEGQFFLYFSNKKGKRKKVFGPNFWQMCICIVSNTLPRKISCAMRIDKQDPFLNMYVQYFLKWDLFDGHTRFICVWIDMYQKEFVVKKVYYPSGLVRHFYLRHWDFLRLVMKFLWWDTPIKSIHVYIMYAQHNVFVFVSFFTFAYLCIGATTLVPLNQIYLIGTPVRSDFYSNIMYAQYCVFVSVCSFYLHICVFATLHFFCVFKWNLFDGTWFQVMWFLSHDETQCPM